MVRPWPARTKVASCSSSNLRKKAVTGTCRAFESSRRVASEGDVCPFSIFESMPVDMLAIAASSATVMLSLRRKSRTSRPIASSRLLRRESAECGSWKSSDSSAGRLSTTRLPDRTEGARRNGSRFFVLFDTALPSDARQRGRSTHGDFTRERLHNPTRCAIAADAGSRCAPAHRALFKPEKMRCDSRQASKSRDFPRRFYCRPATIWLAWIRRGRFARTPINRGSTMNQRDLFAAVQKKSGVALKDVKAVVEAFFDTVTKTSKKEPVRTTLAPSSSRSAPPAWAATRRPAKPSRSRPPRSSASVRPSRPRKP